MKRSLLAVTSALFIATPAFAVGETHKIHYELRLDNPLPFQVAVTFDYINADPTTELAFQVDELSFEGNLNFAMPSGPAGSIVTTSGGYAFTGVDTSTLRMVFTDFTRISFDLTVQAEPTGDLFRMTFSDAGGGGTLFPSTYPFNPSVLSIYKLGNDESGLAVYGFGSPTVEGVSWSANFVAAPVPEPSSYAMMLGGLMLFGVAARRRSS